MKFLLVFALTIVFSGVRIFALENTVKDEPPKDEKSAITQQAIDSANILQSAFVIDDKRLLIPGDSLRFQILEDEEPAILLRVNDDGFIDFPYVGQIQVENRTCKSIKDEIEPLLTKEYYYKATVFLGLEKGNPIRGKVYLIGEIRSQGPQGIPVDTEFTLSKAILAAGGFTEYAKKETVTILRKNPNGADETIVVDAEKIFKDKIRDNDPLLKPDDYIYIPKSRINF